MTVDDYQKSINLADAFRLGYFCRDVGTDVLDDVISALPGKIPDSILSEMRRRVDRIDQSWLDHEAFLAEVRTQVTLIDPPVYHGPDPADMAAIQRLADGALPAGTARTVYGLAAALGELALAERDSARPRTRTPALAVALERIPLPVVRQTPALQALAECVRAGGGPSEWFHTCLKNSERSRIREWYYSAVLDLAIRIAGELEQMDEVNDSSSAPGETTRQNDCRDSSREADEPQYVFQRVGHEWNIQYGDGGRFPMRHFTGLDYLSILLRCSPKALTATQLRQEVGSKRSDPSLRSSRGAAEYFSESEDRDRLTAENERVADDEAIRRVQTKLQELEGELEKARDRCDEAQTAQLENQRSELQAYLDEALCPNGHGRFLRSRLKRDQDAVRKAIKTAMAKIAEADPQLGRHLGNSIRFGGSFQYYPEQPIDWKS